VFRTGGEDERISRIIKKRLMEGQERTTAHGKGKWQIKKNERAEKKTVFNGWGWGRSTVQTGGNGEDRKKQPRGQNRARRRGKGGKGRDSYIRSGSFIIHPHSLSFRRHYPLN
jgi:hypothetical protein